MKVRCGYTSCKNNKQTKGGYFCSLKEIHLISCWTSVERITRMICEQYKNKKGYYYAEEQTKY